MDFDHALRSLKMFIKKEIIDNYFAERTFLEEDLEALRRKVAEYEEEVAKILPVFAALYALLRTEAAAAAFSRLLGWRNLPFYEEARQVPPASREAALRLFKPRGWTAKSRMKHQLYELYAYLQQALVKLKEKRDKMLVHWELHNEDVKKFNENFDFNLIASQVEALEGEPVALESGLSAADRDALAARMRLRLQDLPAAAKKELPVLPPLAQIKRELARLVADYL